MSELTDAGAPLVLELGEARPRIDDSAWVAPGATVVGDVTLGPRASVWYTAVIRADTERIVLGEATNLQDGAVIHADPRFPAILGDRVTVGHRAVIHGSVIEDECLIGMGAVLLNGTRVGTGSLIAAGAVLLEGTEVPPGSLVAGVPGKVRRPLTEQEAASILRNATGYADRIDKHKAAIRV